jgi:hypothetical protein
MPLHPYYNVMNMKITKTRGFSKYTKTKTIMAKASLNLILNKNKNKIEVEHEICKTKVQTKFISITYENLNMK